MSSSIVPGLFLLTIWSLIVPSIVLEGKSAGESFGRSRELVRGHGWNVFGVIIITIGAVIVASLIVTIATVWLPDGVDSFVSDVISNTVVAPFVAVAWTLMYFALAAARGGCCGRHPRHQRHQRHTTRRRRRRLRPTNQARASRS